MSEEKKEFKLYEENFNETLNKYVNEALNDDSLNNLKPKEWLNELTSKIIKDLDSQKLGFKYLVNGFIKDKGYCNLNWVSGNIWIKQTDGAIKIPLNNDKIDGYIILYVVAP
jgi:hypothetical protein